jgi:hypothetical protein
MFTATTRGDIVKITQPACSYAQFYSVYWERVYGVSLPATQPVTASTIENFARKKAFLL